jgi:radical SAM protein with 4Fe4S-binding SPASM domain
MGLLVSVFTNACLLTEEHVKLFKSYPPRAVEVTVYGVTANIYERVTRTPGSYKRFRRGLDLLINSGVNVNLKAMALRSNISEFAAITDFCKRISTTPFRFDPFLHLRIDRNPERNQEIKSERLPINSIVSLEQKDSKRYNALKIACKKLVHNRTTTHHNHQIFNCGAGTNIFAVGWDGSFRLCPSLSHPDCITDLRKRSLRDIQKKFIPYVRAMTASDTRFHDMCGSCPIIDLCYWCPAHAYLETGNLIEPVDYFCELAHARVEPALPR